MSGILRYSLWFGALILVGCQSSLVPVSELALWTKELRMAQPEDPFVAVYKSDKHSLVFLGAEHSNHTDSLTFKLIKEVYKSFPVETIIVEGPIYSAGPNEPALLDWVQSVRVASGFQKEGEIIEAVHGAISLGATVWGGEPEDEYLLKYALSKGFTRTDLVGFYTLRSVPQWIRERRIESAVDPKVRGLVEAELIKSRLRLGIDSRVLPTFETWLSWYSSVNNKEFGAKFNPEETGPLSPGRYGSNRIASVISVARAEYLLHRIAHHVRRGESTLVVYGYSHLMIHRPALDKLFGPPCYVGNVIKSAVSACPN